MAKTNKNEFRLEIGDMVISLVCPSIKYADSMIKYFGIGNSAKKPDILLTLNPVYHENIINIPNSLFTTKTIKDDNFFIDTDLATGFLNKKGVGEINYKIGITEGQIKRVFEQLLYQAFYSACKLKKNNSFLIHSSGVIYKDKGFLFCGPSESGKSTVANLSQKYHVLNDEICLISNKNNKLFLHSTPFNGFYTNKKAGYAQLEAIFYLEHGKTHKIAKMKKSSAVKFLAKEIVPPVGLSETIKHSTFPDMLDKAEMLYNKTDVKKLKFLPDNGFWHEINNNYFKD